MRQGGYTFGGRDVPFGSDHNDFGALPLVYTNNNKVIMDQLQKVIDEAGFPASILWDFGDFKGSEGIVLRPTSSDVLEYLAGAITRRYEYEISYYMVMKQNRKEMLDELSFRHDKLENILAKHVHEVEAGTYYWHDGNVLESILDDELSETEEAIKNLHVSRMTYGLSKTEILN